MIPLKKNSLTRNVLVILMSVCIIFGVSIIVNIAFGNYSQFDSVAKFFIANSYGISFGFGFWLINGGIGRLIGKKLNWRKNPVKANLISLLSFIFGGMVISVLVPYIHLKYMYNISPERLLGAISGIAFMALAVDLIVISIYYSQYIVSYWGKSIENEEALKRENLIAKYEALKNQVNPHFLFNTLNTLTGVVEQTPEQATKFIRKLSDIYRYVLEQQDKELIDIENELKFMNDYVYLSKMRYGNGLNIINNLKSEKLKIIPLGIQMLIENAIKHNIISDDEPLNIELGENGDYIYVKNNFQPKKNVYDNHKMGINNLVKRYEFLTDKPVLVIKTEMYFEVKLPILQNPEK